MGKNKSKKQPEQLPFISVCTPTYNRRPFIPFMIKCFEHQTYPKDRIEWIIVDDGTDPIGELVTHIPQVKYFLLPEKLDLGKKRNYMHEKCTGEIIVYMDDDDYYPPERFSHAVQTLLDNPKCLIAGSSTMFIYFKHISQMYQAGPYGPNHATAATFAFRRRLITQTKYEDTALLAEERKFLKNYTLPLVQLDPKKTILVFSHAHNTFDKKKMLENPANCLLKVSPVTVEELMPSQEMQQFYVRDIDTLLDAYQDGRPENKPRLLDEIKRMETERREMAIKQMEFARAQQMVMEKFNSVPVPPAPVPVPQMEQMRQQYEKQLSDKNYLIGELMKKIKDLNSELDRLRQPPVSLEITEKSA